jgi:hypothetical protein
MTGLNIIFGVCIVIGIIVIAITWFGMEREKRNSIQ